MRRKGNSERPNEVLARKFLESELNIELEYNDATGQADYFCSGSGDLVEVTSYFMQDYFENDLMHAKDNLLIETHILSFNWLVAFDRYPKRNHVEAEVVPHLQRLEIHQIGEFHDSSHIWWMKEVPSLSETLRKFAKFGITSLIS